MREIANVVLRGRTFHFRRVVPVPLRSALGRRELLRSLGTSHPRTARLRAAQLYVASERIFTAVTATGMFTPDDLARLVQDFYATVLEQENRVRLSRGMITAEVCEKRGAFYERVARDERLSGEIFYTFTEARVVIENGRRHSNTVRPHASLEYRPPAPEVFMPVFSAWPAALARPVPPARIVARGETDGPP